MAQRKGGWGSFLGSAVSGLESRLDSILTDDDQASAKSRAADAAAKEAAEKQRLHADQVSRSSSRTRPNSRLQDRLAKAVNKGKDGHDSRPSSDLGSRPESPSKPPDHPPEIPIATKPDNSKTNLVLDQPVSIALPELLNTQPSPSPRPSLDSPPPAPALVSASTSASASASALAPALAPASIDPPPPTGPAIQPPPDHHTLQLELSALQTTHQEALREHRQELTLHLERIDALQSKLIYLSHQLASSAKAASSDPDATPLDKKLADKDAHIAQLLEEGQKLSKTEMKHMTTIKKMRAKALEADKDMATLKQRLSQAEKSLADQTDRTRRAEAAEKNAQEKLSVVAKIEKDIGLIRSEREEAGLTIAELRRQLSDALQRAEHVEKKAHLGALEAEKRVAASLQEDIESLRLEKKLADDRAKRELQEARDEATRQQERAKLLELELRSEIAVRSPTKTPHMVVTEFCRIKSLSLSCSEAAPRKFPLQQPETRRPNCCAKSRRYKRNTPWLRRTGRASKAR